MQIYCLSCKSNKVQELVEGNKVFYYCPDCKSKSGRALIVDSNIRIIKTSRGIKHIAVAGIIIKDEKMLFVDRRTYPYGLELPAGHVENDESLEEALYREVYEEVSLKVTGATLLAQIEHPESHCRYGSDIEEWSVFLVQTNGGDDFVSSSEIASIVWLPLNDIPRAKLTEPTQYALDVLGYLKPAKAE